MTGVEAIGPVSGATALTDASAIQANSTDTNLGRTGGADFADLIAQGLGTVEAKIDHADDMVRAFTLDQNVPVHQVTIALAEASLAVELAMQVRTRVVEAYREVMNTQL